MVTFEEIEKSTTHQRNEVSGQPVAPKLQTQTGQSRKWQHISSGRQETFPGTSDRAWKSALGGLLETRCRQVWAWNSQGSITGGHCGRRNFTSITPTGTLWVSPRKSPICFQQGEGKESTFKKYSRTFCSSSKRASFRKNYFCRA